MSGLVVAVLCGALALGGVWLVAGAFVARHPRLADAVSLIDGRRFTLAVEPAEGVDVLGAWARRHWSGGLNDVMLRQLQLRRISTNRFYSYKVIGSVVGFALPGLVTFALLLTTDLGIVVPGIAALVGGVVGFLVPDLLMRRSAAATTSDATEALLTFVDLVTLERLANRSATQALHAAAGVSDVAVFVAIRDALQRARLEQRAPFAELKHLAATLELPALADIADVMKLDDAGAALSGALRARVKELRDAHLTAAKITASNVSERMTLFMVIPSMIFGLIFLVPPLLRLISQG